jgi:hypothetical protein
MKATMHVWCGLEGSEFITALKCYIMEVMQGKKEKKKWGKKVLKCERGKGKKYY